MITLSRLCILLENLSLLVLLLTFIVASWNNEVSEARPGADVASRPTESGIAVTSALGTSLAAESRLEADVTIVTQSDANLARPRCAMNRRSSSQSEHRAVPRPQGAATVQKDGSGGAG